jgi:predicted patatin/cPLA2 family phospholipase
MSTEQIAHERNRVVDLIHHRRAVASKPGARTDGRRLALAIEGGGMRGVVSCAMTAALEQLGTLDCFDAIYGSSAGAISASYFLAAQARYGLTILYENINNNYFIDLKRLFQNKSVISPEYLLDMVCRDIKILDCDAILNSGIKLNIVATSVATLSSVVLKNFENEQELFDAMKCSSRIPFLAGPPVQFRDDRYLDASLHQSIPYAPALADGFTDIVVLLTRPKDERRNAPNWIDKHLIVPYLNRINPRLGVDYLRRDEVYRQELSDIYGAAQSASQVAGVLPIQIPSGGPRITQLEKRRSSLLLGAMAGYRAAYEAIEDESPAMIEILMPVSSVSRIFPR